MISIIKQNICSNCEKETADVCLGWRHVWLCHKCNEERLSKHYSILPWNR